MVVVYAGIMEPYVPVVDKFLIADDKCTSLIMFVTTILKE